MKKSEGYVVMVLMQKKFRNDGNHPTFNRCDKNPPVIAVGDQQLFHQMGHYPVPNPHGGVELVGRADAAVYRQHLKKHSHSQFCYLMRSGIYGKFHLS